MATLAKKKVENNGVNNADIKQKCEEFKQVSGATELPPQIEETETKETNITFRLTEQEKVNYKTFFASQNVSLSFGIKLAIEHLMQDVKDGKGTIKSTGYYKH